jgi:hypothetical protein
MRVAAERLRHDFLQLGLNLVDGLAGCEARPVADAVDVGVDGEGLLSEGRVEHDVRGFPADARQCLQLLAGTRNLATVIADQRLGQCDDVPGLGVEEANGLDRVAKPFLAEINHLPRGLDALEQGTASDVNACVGRLGGKRDRDEELERIARFELGRRRGVRLSEPAEEFEDLFARHWAAITSRIA